MGWAAGRAERLRRAAGRLPVARLPAHARAVATANGPRIGRPSVVDPHKPAYAAHLRQAGDSIAEIVAKTGITRSSLYRHLPPRPDDPVTAAGTNPTRP